MPWEPLRAAEREPTRVSEPLDALITRLSGVSASTLELVMEEWETIVGPQVAAATAPVKIDNGVLVVRVQDPIWTTELRWLEPTILERTTALAGTTEITSIKVRVAPS